MAKKPEKKITSININKSDLKKLHLFVIKKELSSSSAVINALIQLFLKNEDLQKEVVKQIYLNQ